MPGGTFDPYVFDFDVFDTSEPDQPIPATFGRSDLALEWDVFAADLGLLDNDLELDGGLETAVILSLFTDRRAEDWDTLPFGQRDRRGCWIDAFPVVPGDRYGSLLWMIAGEKESRAVVERAQQYAAEALAWLIADKVASAVDVTAEIVAPGRLGIAVTITRPSVDPVQYRFNYTWEAQATKAT